MANIEKNFRKFKTTAGKLVLAGKNAEQNEKIVNQAENDELVLHTKAAGSAFVNIKATAENGKKQEIGKKDIKEAAVFCAKYSRDWKKAKRKKDIEVHVFRKKDIYKSKDMKTGTFGVKKFKRIIVKKEEIK